MRRKKTLLALATLAASVCLAVGTTAASERAPGSLEGAWIGTAAITSPPGMPSFPSTDIYTPSATWPGRGTVLCTLPGGGRYPVFVDGQPAHFVKSLPTGSGSWVRTGRSTFAVTVWRILLDADTGTAAGMAKFWGNGRLESRDRMSVAMKLQFFDLEGAPISSVMEGTVTSTRVVVDLEAIAEDEAAVSDGE